MLLVIITFLLIITSSLFLNTVIQIEKGKNFTTTYTKTTKILMIIILVLCFIILLFKRKIKKIL